MKYYFSWVDEGAKFCPDLHLREDEKIFSLQIMEEEGSVPQARITIENSYHKKTGGAFEGLDKPEGSYCFIAVKKEDEPPQLLFRGRLVDFPTSLQGEIITLDFIALSRERESRYDRLLDELKESPQFENLFLPLSKRDAPDVNDLLSSQATLMFWDRTSHEVSLSDFARGSKYDDVAGNYFRDSLNVKITGSPLEEIEVHLHAKWIQRFQGSTCFDHLLQGELGEGVLETYSGADLEKKWWRSDQQGGGHFQQSGYKVLASSLTSLPKLERRDGFFVSPQDPVLKKKSQTGLRNDALQEPKKIHFKRKSYKPALTLGWRYIQPRHEEVIFTLKNDFQALSYKPSSRKVLHLNLYDLVAGEQLAAWAPDIYYKRGEKVEHQGEVFQSRRSHRSSQGSSQGFSEDTIEWESLGARQAYPLQQHRGTFFKGDRGHQVIDQALKKAKAYLCASSRCVEISFICRLEQALSWSCDHVLCLEDERLPGARALGKVKRLTFEVLGKTGRMRAYVTLACSIGTGKAYIPESPQEGYGEEGLLEAEPLRSWSYKEEDGAGLMYPAMLGASDLLREVTVSHGAEEQRALLQQNQYPTSHNILENLKGKSTQVKLRLEDLRGTSLEKTVLRLENLQAYSAPKQITIGA